jgi:protein-L-isoaspartate(D-aspartate) O-methyltransferase
MVAAFARLSRELSTALAPVAILSHVPRPFDTPGQRAGRVLAPAVLVAMLLGLLSFVLFSRADGDGPAGPDWAAQRLRMVGEQIRARGVTDPATLRAMETVPRHEFVPEESRALAYRDHPLPIGYEQTISQPYIVAYMTEALRVKRGDKVLEIGTGSGYQAAVLAAVGAEVFSIEIVEPLGTRAAALLERLGCRVEVLVGDGTRGWPEAAPFDGIIVTAAPPSIPQPLAEQLKEGGRMVVPVGRGAQDLQVLVKSGGKLVIEDTLPVRFVPMVGEAGG